jgi:hypothetical protein
LGKGLPEPDLTIFMDADADEVAKRAGYGGEIFEIPAFQKKVSLIMREMAYGGGDRAEKPGNDRGFVGKNNDGSVAKVLCIKGGETIDEIFTNIKSYL